jgi:hypothetical protein
MDALHMEQIKTPADAQALLRKLGADGLVVGTITFYQPYDPPKLGLALELYTSEQTEHADAVDVRRLTMAATDTTAASAPTTSPAQPVSVVSTVLDGADPGVRDQLEKYATRRGTESDPNAWRRYRSSMDLYSEFAGYVMSWRLLEAEKSRLAAIAGGPNAARR